MIIHVDMDAFYASIEQRDNPSLRGKPLVVGGSKEGRGVVAAASYEARRFGIHSAMSARRASQLCPDALFVKTNMAKYAAVGRQIREIFADYTPLVQPLSLDEAFLDVTGTAHLFGSAESIGRIIQRRILEELNLPASVGIAPNKSIAKIASDLDKPRGFVIVRPNEVHDFLDPLAVSRLWGVGRVADQRLQRLGIKTIADIRRRSCDEIDRLLGRFGKHLWQLANGIDERDVVCDRKAKQISHERTFREDIRDIDLLKAILIHLVEQVACRIRYSMRHAIALSLKTRRFDFKTTSLARTLDEPTDSTDKLCHAAQELLAEARRRDGAPLRLLGLSASRLSDRNPATQLDLFESQSNESHARLDRVMDKLNGTHRGTTIYRAASHQWIQRRKTRGTAEDDPYDAS